MSSNRRRIFRTVVGLALVGTTPAVVGAVVAPLAIDAARLQRSLEDLSVFGRPSGGSFADGVSRFAYSDADIAGRAFVIQLVNAVGLLPRIDTAGNIRVRYEGTVAGLKPILIGSHIDSVPGGGNFDGALGSMAAIEILRTLQDRKIRLRHPLEVALWSNEEGGTVGSGLATGTYSRDTLDLTLNGIKRADGLKRIGGDPERLAEAQIAPGLLLTVEPGTSNAETFPIGAYNSGTGVYTIALAYNSGKCLLAHAAGASVAVLNTTNPARELFNGDALTFKWVQSATTGLALPAGRAFVDLAFSGYRN